MSAHYNTLPLAHSISHPHPHRPTHADPTHPRPHTLSLDSIQPLAAQMIGHKLKTKQTTGEGVQVHKVMVAEALDITRETYFAIVMDRATQGPVMVGSPEGGVDIEEVARTAPEKIFKVGMSWSGHLWTNGSLALWSPVLCASWRVESCCVLHARGTSGELCLVMCCPSHSNVL